MLPVIDTNQANRVPTTLPAGVAGLTLSPFLLAEVFLRSRGPRIETLALLSRHDVRIGMQPAEMLDLVATLGADAIAELTPFPAPSSEFGTGSAFATASHNPEVGARSAIRLRD